MNTSQKLYQLIINRLDGHRISDSDYRNKIFDLCDKGLGGVIIFGGKRDEISDFVRILQARAEIPLFISSDIERGVGQQIDGYASFPCPMAVAAAIDRDNPKDVLTLNAALRAVFIEAIEVGINMPLLPVLDVNHNPSNPIICTRAFSDDPETVAWFGQIYIKAMNELGLFACAKHFPGHGDTEIDSHLKLPEINRTFAQIMRLDVAPFKAAINAGVSCVMAGHIKLPALDNLPASLSSVILNDILRKECGFRGLILTDALNMGALNEISDIAVKSIIGGADILLHPTDADKTVVELNTALTEHRLEMDRIDVSINRIMELKAKIKDIKLIKDEGAQNLSQEIVNNSITLVKGSYPLLKGKDVIIIIIGEREGRDISPFVDVIKGSFRIIKVIDYESDIELYQFKNKSVIFLVISKVAAWRGTSGISDKESNVISGIIANAKESIVVSNGSPYLLSKFLTSDGLIAAYEFTCDVLIAAAQRIIGERPCLGRLPVLLYQVETIA
jgi:beta-glucosidase-like glycosyl hydrolase